MKTAQKTYVEFCRLDARDDPYTGYYPVAFSTRDGHGHMELGPKNSRLEMEMRREYLTRITALQVELRSKYLSKFDADEETLDRNKSYDGFLSREDYEKAKAEVEAMFPGREAEYYT